MASAMRPLALFEQGDDACLNELPLSHRRLFEEQRRKLGHALAAIIDDRAVDPYSTPVLVVIASLHGKFGQKLARIYSTEEDVHDEIYDAADQSREPVIVETFVGAAEVDEFIEQNLPAAKSYVEKRLPGAVVALIVDAMKQPVVATVRPFRPARRGWWQGAGS